MPSAIVIGSGFGGLAAAIRLRSRGYSVTVLEQLDRAGGRARVFEQDGFLFDAGPTIITAPFLLRELWRLGGGDFDADIRLTSLDPFYRIRFDDGDVLDVGADAGQMRAQIQRIEPGDVQGYEKFLAQSAAICAVAFDQLAHVPFDSIWKMLRLVPQLLRFRSDRSVHALAARCVKHPKLRFALSFHPLFVGGNPFATPSIYGLIAHLERAWGVHFVKGGTGALIAGMLRLVRERGDEVRFNARVRQVRIERGRAVGVQLAGGEIIGANVIVSNADAASLYTQLVPEPYRWSQARAARAKYSMSLFVWYFGTDRKYPELPHHTILCGPRYHGLIEDIFKHHVLAPDFSLYLHRPTATDAALAPAGCDAFYVLSPVPHLAARVDWREQAEPYRSRIEQFLAATVLPDLRAHVVTSRLMTPLDFRDELGAMCGSAFGLEPRLLQSAWFRPHNRSERIDGLYLVGAGTHPGAGVPGVLSSARVLDTVVPDARH